jgi:hypothetical protein
MTLPLGFLPVDIGGAVVKYGVIVEKLDVARTEFYIETKLGVVGQACLRRGKSAVIPAPPLNNKHLYINCL